jgi:sterol desaturase/sphingolipid hydroxylase (fatty acid hydroxylase superfamily)
VMLTVFAALERWRPVEPVTDRHAVRVDVVYTLIHRLGLVRLVLFLSVDPLWDLAIGKLRVWGLPAWSVDAIWPGVTDVALVSFVLYLLLFDAVDYALHRAQHQFGWWWQLHALHHSQRQMTMWTDNRNHLLDDLLRDVVFVGVALLVGIPPSQFVAVVALTQLVESLSHANVRLSFGPLMQRVLVGPQYHRLHHRIGVGHESRGEGTLGGANFAVLFPLWDLLFGTARFDGRYDATGIRDQLPEAGGRNYGHGFWAQQGLGLQRLAQWVTRRQGRSA